MKITMYGDIIGRKLKCCDFEIENLYDPNELLEKFNNQMDLIIVVELKVSKKGNLIALVRDIKQVE